MLKKRGFLAALCLSVFLCGGCVSGERVTSLSQIGDLNAVADHIGAAMDGFLTDNRDDYATYLSLSELNQMFSDYEGEFGGIGVYIGMEQDAEYPNIVDVMSGEPAEIAGVRAGDLMVGVDGEDIAGMDINDVSALVRGEIGSSVRLTLQGEDGTLREVSVTRENIESVSVTAKELPDYPDIAYIQIYNFSELTPEDFRVCLTDLNKTHKRTGLIIDLRGNGGGSFPACLKLASMFVVKDEPLVWVKTRSGLDEEKSTGRIFELPVVCLQNGGSASASEVLLGALTDNGAAVSVGTQSYGKGITQSIYALRSGAGLRYTNGKYFTPNHTDLHGIGLAPTYEIELEEGTVSEDLGVPETDAQLKFALDLLREE